jgi:hypothetical protein
MSIGLQNPINGSSLGMGVPTGRYLGRGIRGYIAPDLITTDNYDTYARERFTLREGWNTTYPAELAAAKKPRIVTPFRAVTNSGDLLCRQAYSCGGPCQTFQSRPGLRGLAYKFGAVQDRCDGSGVKPAACNQRFVYDSSDYITYKKQSAIVKNYNALTNGGDEYNGSQVAFKAIRRY